MRKLRITVEKEENLHDGYCSDSCNYTLKEDIDTAYEDYEDGFRVGDA